MLGFDAATGHLSYTGHTFACNSPNFVGSASAQATQLEDEPAIGASISADSVMARSLGA